jgi:hypothetical protein
MTTALQLLVVLTYLACCAFFAAEGAWIAATFWALGASLWAFNLGWDFRR